MRATQFSNLILLENVVDARLERIRAEEQSIPSYRIRVWLPESVLIFANDLDVGTHQYLEARAKAVPRLVFRCMNAIHEVRMGIHGVVVERPNQPRIKPIVGACEPAGEFHGGSGNDSRRRSGSEQVIVVMAKHSESE